MSAPPSESLQFRLHAAMSARHAQAKRAWTGVIAISFVSMGLSGLSTFAPSAQPAMSFLAIIVGIALFLLRLHARTRYAEAEELRRAYRFLRGTGVRPRDGVARTLPAKVHSLDLGVVSLDREYYSAKEPPGPRLLALNLEESAWYTQNLANRTSLVCGAIALLGLIVVIGLLEYEPTVGLARLAPHIFGLFVAGIFSELAVSFRRLHRTAHDTLLRLEKTYSANTLHLEDVIPAIADYDCALASVGMPIPDWIYSRMRADLDLRWSAYALERGRPELAPAEGMLQGDKPNASICPPSAALRQLIYKLFDDVELRMFARDLCPDVVTSLPGQGASLASITEEFLQGAERHGYAGARFFRALREARPRHAPAIAEVEQMNPFSEKHADYATET